MIAHAIPTMSRGLGIWCKKTVARIVCTTHYDCTIALDGPASPKVAE